MVFKIDNDIIANALKKEFTKEIPASIGNILRDEIEKKQKETSTKKESDNLSDVKDLFEIKEKKKPGGDHHDHDHGGGGGMGGMGGMGMPGMM